MVLHLNLLNEQVKYVIYYAVVDAAAFFLNLI